MNVTNEKELWEAFRNQETTIVAEGDLVSRLKKWIVITKLGWAYAAMGVLAAVMLGGLGSLLGLISSRGQDSMAVLYAVLLAMPGLLIVVFGILLALGKLGGICGQLAKYRAKEEWGVLTLTRK